MLTIIGEIGEGITDYDAYKITSSIEYVYRI